MSLAPLQLSQQVSYHKYITQTHNRADAEDGETKLELDDSRKLSMQEKFDVLKGAPRES